MNLILPDDVSISVFDGPVVNYPSDVVQAQIISISLMLNQPLVQLQFG